MIFADLALAQRIEAAEAALAAECASAGGSQGACERIGGGCAVFAGAGSPLTHAVGLGMRAPVTAAQMDQIETFFHSRGADVTIDLCPLADPSLVELAGQRGYRAVEFNNVLARPATGVDPAPADSPFSVRQAASGDAELWALTVGRGFFDRERLSAEEFEVGQTIFRMPGARCFLALTAAGAPAGAAALSVHGQTALLFADSTVPRLRRQGVHRALIAHRLQSLPAEGRCDLAVAATVPGSPSQRNYERMGFRVVYTRVMLVRS